MSTSTPQKPAVSKPTSSLAAPPKTATMFGVSIQVDNKKADEKRPMTRNKKAGITAGVLLGLSGVVLYLQYHNRTLDLDAAEHPAVKEVTQLAEKKDTGGLLQYTRNEDIIVAQRAVSALARVGGADSLREVVNDPRADVRSLAVAELASHADVEQLPALGQYLQDPDPGVKLAAMRGIAAIRDFSIFDYLVPMLNDPQPVVRRGAIQAIEARMGMRFSDFDPNDAAASQRAVARIRSMLPNFKERFDNVNQIESQKKK
jgi:hypothetical protein